jgi:hypothetical protein
MCVHVYVRSVYVRTKKCHHHVRSYTHPALPPEGWHCKAGCDLLVLSEAETGPFICVCLCMCVFVCLCVCTYGIVCACVACAFRVLCEKRERKGQIRRETYGFIQVEGVAIASVWVV